MNSSAQALSLIGQSVTIQDSQDSGTTIGTVAAVTFNSSGPSLSLTVGDSSNSQELTGISLSQIIQVNPVGQNNGSTLPDTTGAIGSNSNNGLTTNSRPLSVLRKIPSL
jgi:flagellar hook assembly protein FlgD